MILTFIFVLFFFTIIIFSVRNQKYARDNKPKLVVMDQDDYFSESGVDVDLPLENKINGEKSKKCSQCNYASFWGGTLRRHLKTHSGVKSHKCNQCDYASSQAGNLRKHLEKHSGEK